MMQTIFNANSENSDKLLCLHVNETRHIQIARLKKSNVDCQYERVVYPGERLLFEAVPDAQLEIYTCMNGKEFLYDIALCDRICVSTNNQLLELANLPTPDYICL